MQSSLLQACTSQAMPVQVAFPAADPLPERGGGLQHHHLCRSARGVAAVRGCAAEPGRQVCRCFTSRLDCCLHSHAAHVGRETWSQRCAATPGDTWQAPRKPAATGSSCSDWQLLQ